ncbi:MAG: 3'-5' exonuclease [Rickettsiaceae bacterium H1]|nr:3'-5' exonuclease [Rickettsiaceae bacterium H1]
MLQSILVFDIETIPDTEVCEALTGSQACTTLEQREELIKYHLEITDGKNPFLRQPFHKIIAISFLHAGLTREGRYECYSLEEIKSGGKQNSSEAELIRGFLNLIAKIKPRLISFNGRTFDLPVIKYRAMLHGIQAEYLYRSGDKWNNYTQRYSLDWHCDLLEALSDYGASAKVKMNEVCAALKLPGKIGTEGSQVTQLYDSDKIEEIRNYCETDVINTYLIYLRFTHYQGYIKTTQYNHCIKELIKQLQREEKEHFDKFYSEWKRVCKNSFFI